MLALSLASLALFVHPCVGTQAHTCGQSHFHPLRAIHSPVCLREAQPPDSITAPDNSNGLRSLDFFKLVLL